jgi:hypothetical protein
LIIAYGMKRGYWKYTYQSWGGLQRLKGTAKGGYNAATITPSHITFKG